jgi:hypothetical protein
VCDSDDDQSEEFLSKSLGARSCVFKRFLFVILFRNVRKFEFFSCVSLIARFRKMFISFLRNPDSTSRSQQVATNNICPMMLQFFIFFVCCQICLNGLMYDRLTHSTSQN